MFNYFRLLQVDLDGNTTQYDVVSKNCNPSSQFDVTVAPNPNNGDFTLNIYSDRSQDIIIQLVNNEGKVVFSEPRENSTGSSKNYINFEGIATGIYTLQVYHLDGILNKKIAVQ